MKFIHEIRNVHDEVQCKIDFETRQEDLYEILEDFKGFLQACGYQIPVGSTIEIIEPEDDVIEPEDYEDYMEDSDGIE